MRVPFNDFGLVFDRPQHRFEVPYSFKVGGGPIPLPSGLPVYPCSPPSGTCILAGSPVEVDSSENTPPCTALVHSFPALP